MNNTPDHLPKKKAKINWMIVVIIGCAIFAIIYGQIDSFRHRQNVKRMVPEKIRRLQEMDPGVYECLNVWNDNGYNSLAVIRPLFNLSEGTENPRPRFISLSEEWQMVNIGTIPLPGIHCREVPFSGYVKITRYGEARTISVYRPFTNSL